jgi:transcription elongation factor GreA
MSEQPYLTADGAKKIKEELESLKGQGREEIAKRLRSAIQMGDLSENADYSKAKEDQAFLEGRIQELDYLLHNAVIIDESNQKRDEVQVGARVTIQEGDEEAETYHLVGAKEADPRKGRISNESPFGRALIGGKVGDRVEVETPGGKVHLKILKIE